MEIEDLVMIIGGILFVLCIVGMVIGLSSALDEQRQKCKDLHGEYFTVYGGGNCVIPK